MNESALMGAIANMIREAYPDAVAVTVFVNQQEASIEKQYRHKLDGISMRNLSGEWVRESKEIPNECPKCGDPFCIGNCEVLAR